MEYKIAVGTSEGIQVDLKFGEAAFFQIYLADENGFRLLEKRQIKSSSPDGKTLLSGCDGYSEKEKLFGGSCEGCTGNGHGCGAPGDIADKVNLIGDCRCIVCKKIGFQAVRQLERKAISVFDVDCSVNDALNKITSYYTRIDSGMKN